MAARAAALGLERARGESAALRNLANAARMIEANPALMNLRLLQTIAQDAGVAGTTRFVVNLPHNTGENGSQQADHARFISAPRSATGPRWRSLSGLTIERTPRT